MWWTDTRLYRHGGCHGFLSKASGIMAHPLVMSALEQSGGRKELKAGERWGGEIEEGRVGGGGVGVGGGSRGAACCS